jgi:hypothetical protein
MYKDDPLITMLSLSMTWLSELSKISEFLPTDLDFGQWSFLLKVQESHGRGYEDEIQMWLRLILLLVMWNY